MTQTLTLPDGVTVTSNALTCSRDLTLDEWKALGQTLRQFEGSIQWWLGDWWRNGEHSYGKRKALTTARKTFERGYSFGTLMNYGYVAGRTETSRRREALKYSHHYEVASLPPEEQDRWLDIAVREKLSVARLREKMCDPVEGPSDDEKCRNYIRRLLEAAEIPDRFTIVLPWKDNDIEDFILRYALPAEYAAVNERFQKIITFWTKTADFIRQIESKSKALKPDEVAAIHSRKADLKERSHQRTMQLPTSIALKNRKLAERELLPA